MTKIDVISGFLGAGKTTLIKKLLSESLKGEKLVLVENEFGDVNIDGSFIKSDGRDIEIAELTSGCVCCSLSGDFTAQMIDLIGWQAPDRILLEPSGVANLSDIISRLQVVKERCAAEGDAVACHALATVVDARKCESYLENFESFYRDQIEHAACILLSRTEGMDPALLEKRQALVRAINPDAMLVTTPWEQLTGEQILHALDGTAALAEELAAQGGELQPQIGIGNLGRYGFRDRAERTFSSWSTQTVRPFSAPQIERMLRQLGRAERYGKILRAKGTVCGENGQWLYFDYLPPQETDIRAGAPCVTGQICVIGEGLRDESLAALFSMEGVCAQCV